MPNPQYRSIVSHPVDSAAAVLLLFLSLIETAQSQDRTLQAIRLTGSITIDGILDEPEWNRPGAGELIQRQPNEGEPASEKTEAWFVYDDGALYIGVQLDDSVPDSILGRLVRRDEEFGSDFILIGLDPKLDRNTGYFFATNPSGSFRDGILFDDNKTDNSYDPVWDVAVARNPRGWSAEFRIPFSQLRFQEKETHAWGVELYRRIHRKSEECLLVHHPRTDEIRVSRFPVLNGIRGITPPPRIEVMPYVTATGKFLPSGVSTFNQGRDDPFVFGRDYLGNIGADAKIGLTGDFTLDATINPDFAQVEVDPAVVNLTAFETFFAEKRPFFIEGSSILSFGRGGAASYADYNWNDPGFFYSRRIGRAPQGMVSHEGFSDIPDRTTILGAAKVSGKTTTGWSLAALAALTDREFGKVDSAGVRTSEEIEPLTFYGVLRSQKQFSDSRHAVGIIGTYVGRDLSEPALQSLLSKHSMSLGFDGWTFLDPAREWVISGWTGFTSVHGSRAFIQDLQVSPTHWFQKPDVSHVSVDPNATSLAGWAGRIWLAKDRGNWRFSTAFGFIDPHFESNDIGYHTYTDVINSHLSTSYYWFEPDPILRTKSVSIAALREYNFGGYKTGETYYLNFNGELLNYWGGSLFVGYNVEVFDDKRTRGGPLMKSLSSDFFFLTLYSDPRSDVHGLLDVSADRGTSGGWDYSFSASLNWKFSNAFNISVGPAYTRNHVAAQYVDAFADAAAMQTFGTRYVFAILDRRTLSAELRLNWTFSPRTSFQLYLQPYLSAGDYSDYRSLARPSSFSFDPYPYPFDPDFNFKSLRANAVFRWEYLPGSTLYLVWTNEKVNYEEHNGRFLFSRDFSEMLRAQPANVLSLKITYWWTP